MSTAVVAQAAGRPAKPAILVDGVLPTLLWLTLPNLAAMLVTALVAITETIYVGKLGLAPLAAMALVFPMAMLMQMLSAGSMGGGISSVISRALGAGDRQRAEALALHAAVIGVGAGLLFSALFLVFGRAIYETLGGRGAVLGEALIYSNMLFAGIIAVWLVNTLSSVLRGAGNMRAPSLTVLAAAAAQVILGGGLSLGLGPFPRLGIIGIAAGQVIASALGAAFLLWLLVSGRGGLRLSLGGGLRTAMFGDILRVGLLASLSPVQSVLTVLILTRIVASFGTEALAGYGIGARLEFLLIPIVFAVGVASVPMVGMAIGAGNVARARRVAWTAGAVSAVAVGAIGATVALAPDLWSGLFTTDAGVRAAANLYLRWAGPGFAFLGLGLCLYFASQGSGRLLGPVLASTTRLLLIAAGGWWLATGDAPLWSLFALIGASMLVFGLGTAAAVRFVSWQPR